MENGGVVPRVRVPEAIPASSQQPAATTELDVPRCSMPRIHIHIPFILKRDTHHTRRPHHITRY